MKQETLEEAAKNYLNSGIIPNDYQSFIAGAKYQAERGYSEEDMKEYAEFCVQCYLKGLHCIVAKDWDEQLRKK